jgi:molybdenum-dependent DNA-binding transcriptional regulator ModE
MPDDDAERMDGGMAGGQGRGRAAGRAVLEAFRELERCRKRLTFCAECERAGTMRGVEPGAMASWAGLQL